MLKLVENPTQDTAAELLSCFSADLHTVHALVSLLDAPALQGVWVQTNAENRTTAILTKLQCGYLRIAAEENADFEELHLFAATFSKALIQTSPEICRKLGIETKSKNSLCALETYVAPKRKAVSVYDGFRPIYELILNTVPAASPPLPASVQENLYNEWLARTVRGVFHGFTRVTAVYAENGDLAATAFADILGNYAYLREVACAPAYRRQGYASACVRTLCGDVKKDGIQHIFLNCTAENESFYQKSGFQKCADLELGFLKL